MRKLSLTVLIVASVLLLFACLKGVATTPLLLVYALFGAATLAVSLSRTPRGKAAVRGFVTVTSLVLAGTILGLILCEGVIRAFDIGGSSYFDQMMRYTYLTRPSRDKVYEHHPNGHAVLQGVPININSRGLRDVERPLKKPRGVFRILLLGDSLVLGWGVRLEDTFAKRLERLLNQRSRQQYRADVINSGVCSYGTYQEYQYLKQEGIRYDPDIVLLFFVPNDANIDANTLPSMQKNPPRRQVGVTPIETSGPPPSAFDSSTERFVQLMQRSRIGTIVWSRFRLNAETKTMLMQLAPHSRFWLTARSCFADMKQLCDRQHAPLLVFHYNVSGASWEKRALARLREVERDFNIPVVDMQSWFMNFPPNRLRNSFFDIHPNAFCHRLIAENVLRELDARHLLPREFHPAAGNLQKVSAREL